MKIKKVALLGAGAVGAYFVWGLAEKQDIDFCVIAKDARKARLEKDGLIINGKQYNPSVKTPEEAGAVDLLLVSSKQDGLEAALPDMQKLVGENTMVISLLNGVSSEDIIGKAVGMEYMLYSVMRIASVREENRINFVPENTMGIFVGEKDFREPTERVLAVEELFRDTGIRYNFVEDIVADIWMKYACNISQNLPQAVLGVGFGAYVDSVHVHAIAEALWKEVVQVAKAKGILLKEELALFNGVRPAARFSTLQDLDAGRHTEIDMLAGEMVRMGEECGIAVPWCEYTYHLIKALEEKNDGKFVY